MGSAEPRPRIVRFGVFELDRRTAELRKHGLKVRLAEQPYGILDTLLEQPGEVISRDDLKKRLWPTYDYFDFDHSLNNAVNRLREALNDSADKPRYVETLPRLGYRFIAPVEPEIVAPQASSFPPAKISSWSETQEMAGVAAVVVLLLLGLGFLVASNFNEVAPQPGSPVASVVGVHQVTQLGRVSGHLGVDGERIYFGMRKGGVLEMAMVLASGGEPIVIPTPFPNPFLYDVSSKGSKLLLASHAGLQWERPLWILEVGGTTRRVGDLTAHDAAWSIDGEQIVYANGSDLYVTRPDGTGNRKIATAPGIPVRPRWSPGGGAIRFTVEDADSSSHSLWEVGLDGSGLHPLFPEDRQPQDRWGDGDSSGIWSPDGRVFVFLKKRVALRSLWAMAEPPGTGTSSVRPQQIHVSPISISSPVFDGLGASIFFVGRQEGQQDLEHFDAAAGGFVPLFPGISVQAASYSPDGSWVAYTNALDSSLWRCKADGSERLRLTPPGMTAFFPTWSPDGRRIAFDFGNSSKPNRIYVADAGGGVPQPITEGRDAHPSWFPDGSSILYDHRPVRNSGDQDPPGLYRMNLLTREKVRLPASEAFHDPSVSPDGRYVAALNEGNKELFLYDARSQSWRRLATGSFLRRPSWSRDGRHIYFQDLLEGESQPIYRVGVMDLKKQRVAGADRISGGEAQIAYFFVGLDPSDSPLASVVTTKSDIYALALKH